MDACTTNLKKCKGKIEKNSLAVDINIQNKIIKIIPKNAKI